MFDVKIKVLKRCIHYDLIKEYENPLTNPCEMIIGDEYISINGKKPEGFCNNAWKNVGEYVKKLANGEENFFDGWMKNKKSAMISCDDGFRPVSFYIEVIE